MGKTEKNLQKAFAGESQASRKYKAFALRADQENYPHVAKLFRAASESETVHATNQLRVIKGINTTEDNLKAAIAGETYEFKEMYPEFIKDARIEEKKSAERKFQEAMETEKYHASYYEEALKNILERKDNPKTDYYICSVCGYTAVNGAPLKCPICGTSPKSFIKVE